MGLMSWHERPGRVSKLRAAKNGMSVGGRIPSISALVAGLVRGFRMATGISGSVSFCCFGLVSFGVGFVWGFRVERLKGLRLGFRVSGSDLWLP